MSEEIYKKATQERVKNAQQTLLEKIKVVLPNIKNTMDSYLARGYYGWEFMRDPHLWRNECEGVVKKVELDVKNAGYQLYMNPKYHTVAILPSREFGQNVQDCFVGFGNNTQFIHWMTRRLIQ